MSWQDRFQDRFYDWRNRLVAKPEFQRWAAAFPFTRWVAARQSRGLFDLCAGFVYSQILTACVELDLFRILSERPQTSTELAGKLSLAPEVTERLLRAAAALGLLAERGQEKSALGQKAATRYGLGLSGAALLGNPGVVSMIRHHRMLYADLADPVALLRNASKGDQRSATALSQFWPYAQSDTTADHQTVSPYSSLMSASQSLVVADILEAYPFRQHRHVMDVGGGEGTFLVSLAAYAPDLRLTLFDLPAVAARAETRFREAGVSDRADAVGGNAATDSLPSGADLVTLVRVLHDHDDDRAMAILTSIHKALPAEGTLLIAEPMADAKGAEPMGDAYFGLYLMAMGSGRPRRPDEIADLLRQAGFGNIGNLKTRRPLMTSALKAQKLAK